MTGSIQNEALFVRSLPTMLSAAAQRLYVDAYKQSMAKSVEGTPDALARESIADRDAWDAVRRDFMEDLVTHKWRRIGDQAVVEEPRSATRSVLGKIKGLFKL